MYSQYVVASTAINYKVPPKCLDIIFETIPTSVHDILFWVLVYYMYFFYSVDNANMFTETLRNGLYTQVHQNFNSQVITCVSFGLIVCYNTRVPNAKSFFVFRVVRYSSITVLYSESVLSLLYCF